MDKQYLTTQQVCHMLQISRYTVYSMVKEGKLKAIVLERKGKKTYRFDPDIINQLIGEV